ncbi:deoxyguanosinetriphosphate triphosphohydrolase [Enterovirga aerilata]|uniref:Deoxyguanosinetriphosphate triphosphohydrolase-like protein n=1 Tax=Enterovirga aerilata TaxID=2730920 RepID=A0A849IHH3_9HYPH|nr:deoxyguanosinetriphosphate triphosphohydrolase [Enterovirga sp. DB1703]
MRPHGERWRAAYSCHPGESRGRLHPEHPSPTRSEFQRDRDRIIHSTAFRRLTHKTQVFIYHEGDHFRTRLTHTLEVSQIARSLARSLGLDEDLAEAVALSHDLGHTPFGHTGEDALEACLASFGGFDHNAQALRIVTRLERRYAAYDGLNLTFETLEGLVKHNGPLLGEDGRPTERYRRHGIPPAITEYDALQPLGLSGHALAEAQAAAIADDIAYNAHDLDDGLRARILDPEELRSVPFLDGLLREIDAAGPDLDPSRRTHELTRRVITRLVEDVLDESDRRLRALRPISADDIRAAGAPVVAFSDAMAEADRSIKGFLFPKLYKHPRLMSVRLDAEAIVHDLFRKLTQEPRLLPEDWRQDLAGAPDAKLARRVADYIAGMTDRYAILEHRRLFGSTPDLRIA